MTALRRDGNDTPFSAWIRSEDRLSSIRERLCVIDCDYWIHNYRAHTDKVGERCIDSIMLVELKTFGAKLPFHQRDTLRIVNEAFHDAFFDKRQNVRTIRKKIGQEVRLVRCYGAFLLQLSEDRPDNSTDILWHGRRVDIDTLIEILNFDRDPRSLRDRSERRHHQPSEKQAHPDFFLVNATRSSGAS